MAEAPLLEAAEASAAAALALALAAREAPFSAKEGAPPLEEAPEWEEEEDLTLEEQATRPSPGA